MTDQATLKIAKLALDLARRALARTGSINVITPEALLNYECFGSPNGQITAPVSSICVQKDGGHLWAKVAGIDDQGWIQAT